MTYFHSVFTKKQNKQSLIFIIISEKMAHFHSETVKMWPISTAYFVHNIFHWVTPTPPRVNRYTITALIVLPCLCLFWILSFLIVAIIPLSLACYLKKTKTTKQEASSTYYQLSLFLSDSLRIWQWYPQETCREVRSAITCMSWR